MIRITSRILAAVVVGVSALSAWGTAVAAPKSDEVAADAARTRAFAVSPVPTSWQAKLTPRMWMEASRSSGGDARVIISLAEPFVVSRRGQAVDPRREAVATVQREFMSRAAQYGLSDSTTLAQLPIIVARVPVDALPDLAQDPLVRSIEPDVTLHTLRKEGGPLMRATQLRAAGGTGAGVTVAVLDTGIDATHPELAGRLIQWKDYITSPPTTQAFDDNDHGTSVSGIVAGTIDGMAPQARLWVAKVLDSTGNGVLSKSLSAIDDILTHIQAGNADNIRVVNMSIGTADSNAVCDSDWPAFTSALQSLNNDGVIIFVSAGNDGCTDGVAFPACISNAVAVGAVYDANGLIGRSYNDVKCYTSTTTCADYAPMADQIACYSDSGDDLDIWAPSHDCRTPKPGGGYDLFFGGTSAAAPYAAGVAAQLFSLRPQATPAAVRAALVASGPSITDARNGITKHRIDAMDAYATLSGSGGGSAYSYWLPVVANGSGVGGSYFYSDVGTLSASTTAASLEFLFYPDSGGSPATGTFSLPAGSQALFRDIVGQLSQTGKGMLEIQSDQPLRVTSRTYNKLSAGNTLGLAAGTTFGQYVDSYVTDDGLSAGESGYLGGLTENASYRTNIAVANAGSAPANVTVTLLDATGVALAQYSVDLQPGQLKQENRPFNTKAGQSNMERGYAKVTVNSGSGVLAYASVLDNTSTNGQTPSDPTTIPLKR